MRARTGKFFEGVIGSDYMRFWVLCFVCSVQDQNISKQWVIVDVLNIQKKTIHGVKFEKMFWCK